MLFFKFIVLWIIKEPTPGNTLQHTAEDIAEYRNLPSIYNPVYGLSTGNAQDHSGKLLNVLELSVQ